MLNFVNVITNKILKIMTTKNLFVNKHGKSVNSTWVQANSLKAITNEILQSVYDENEEEFTRDKEAAQELFKEFKHYKTKIVKILRRSNL